MTLRFNYPIVALYTAVAFAAILLTTSCGTSRPEPTFVDYEPSTWASPENEEPTEPAATSPDETGAAEDQAPASSADVFRVGDVVNVSVTGLRSEEIPAHNERIKDDGTINLYLLGPIQAAGRSPGELQRHLQKRYEVYFKNPVVTVSSLQRFYYVGGEVKKPGAQPYLGATTVTKAIQAAGDFTDFGKKTNVRVIRADGTQLKVNVNKAIDEPSLDPPIYPGDKIHVPRRVLW